MTNKTSRKNTASSLTMAGNIDGDVFTRFAVFNAFVLHKAWRNPLIFAACMTAFSVVCFAVRKTHEQAVLLGTVLLAVGLVLPAVWLGMFFYSVKRQVKINGLSPTKAQYFVTLAPDEIRVTKGEEKAEYHWKEIFRAFHVKGCIYLYVTSDRAYLMPDCEDTKAAWEIISSCLPPEKVLAKAPL